MISTRVLVGLTGLLLAALVLAPVSPGAETVRHSGVVLDVDRQAGTIVLGELREWQAQRGIEIVRRPVVIENATMFVRVRRQGEAPSGYRGDWTEERLDAWSVQAGDFVTVEGVYDGPRLVAMRITVVAGESP
jgi:hypothetical protein